MIGFVDETGLFSVVEDHWRLPSKVWETSDMVICQSHEEFYAIHIRTLGRSLYDLYYNPRKDPR